MVVMDRYPPIAEHGLVGDVRTAAPVSSPGVLDHLVSLDLALDATGGKQ